MRRNRNQALDIQSGSQTGGIVVKGLEKRFGSVRALGGVDLEVHPGEIVALLGPNGAGKTTLLRILGTVLLPDSGQATVAGYDVVSDAREARRSIGLVLSDERSWYWRLSGQHNLEFFGALHGLRRRTARARALALLEAVDLLDAKDRPVSAYSSGMRSRLALARAQIADPPVLLLDEPSHALDPIAIRAMRQDLARLTTERQAAVLFVTHDLHEAAEISDRALVLRKGQVVARFSEALDPAMLEQAMLGEPVA